MISSFQQQHGWLYVEGTAGVGGGVLFGGRKER